jgi:predicted signal transduction protein with EAL and GGDEF domain
LAPLLNDIFLVGAAADYLQRIAAQLRFCAVLSANVEYFKHAKAPSCWAVASSAELRLGSRELLCQKDIPAPPLSQLLSFRLDRIKIDRSFVERLGKDVESDTIVRAILGLAKGFGLATTAEGIEDADQLASLKINGCLLHGAGFGPALIAQQMKGWYYEARSKGAGLRRRRGSHCQGLHYRQGSRGSRRG